jgi:4-hydroxybenzoate polyprenyltransferase
MTLAKLKNYCYLMRLDKPVGILLLLWPTLWALWLASNGKPNGMVLSIFIIGVVLMRSAGCIINDIADRKIDPLVRRTSQRPLATGVITVGAAARLFCILLLVAFSLVLYFNKLTICLAFVGVAFTMIYPFLKRVTHLPQLGLGFAFAWGVPMAFAAVTNTVPPAAWILFLAAVVWPISYDTIYAIVDREDDKRIGVKSTAILFNDKTTVAVAAFQVAFLMLLAYVGLNFDLSLNFYFGLLAAAALFAYQQFLMQDGERDNCFTAFLNNQWVGGIIFIGIVASYC